MTLFNIYLQYVLLDFVELDIGKLRLDYNDPNACLNGVPHIYVEQITNDGNTELMGKHLCGQTNQIVREDRIRK